ncbi:hypothetical protein PR048_020647 [Dryococelus australis]|uniref:Uncharacterized protein n=1 Tax=Dryococelus australis TaxID=614101 RepID=A0ABQ9H6U8_9NEOP|nr:hypothetical protein PR048_020647 [Dryococelus australis]
MFVYTVCPRRLADIGHRPARTSQLRRGDVMGSSTSSVEVGVPPRDPLLIKLLLLVCGGRSEATFDLVASQPPFARRVSRLTSSPVCLSHLFDVCFGTSLSVQVRRERGGVYLIILYSHLFDVVLCTSLSVQVRRERGGVYLIILYSHLFDVVLCTSLSVQVRREGGGVYLIILYSRLFDVSASAHRRLYRCEESMVVCTSYYTATCLMCFGTSLSVQWLDCSPPKANRIRLPVGSRPDIRMWESCRAMPLVGGFSRGSPVPLALHSGAAPHSSRFTPISSQDSM